MHSLQRLSAPMDGEFRAGVQEGRPLERVHFFDATTVCALIMYYYLVSENFDCYSRKPRTSGIGVPHLRHWIGFRPNRLSIVGRMSAW